MEIYENYLLRLINNDENNEFVYKNKTGLFWCSALNSNEYIYQEFFLIRKIRKRVYMSATNSAYNRYVLSVIWIYFGTPSHYIYPVSECIIDISMHSSFRFEMITLQSNL